MSDEVDFNSVKHNYDKKIKVGDFIRCKRIIKFLNENPDKSIRYRDYHCYRGYRNGDEIWYYKKSEWYIDVQKVDHHVYHYKQATQSGKIKMVYDCVAFDKSIQDTFKILEINEGPLTNDYEKRKIKDINELQSSDKDASDLVRFFHKGYSINSDETERFMKMGFSDKAIEQARNTVMGR